MFCISVSFKKTPLPVRQRFAFSKEEQEHFLFRLMEKQEITGGVVVSTCNRSELYFTGTKENVDEVENQLSLVKTIEKEQIKKYGLYYQGKKAVQHLFRVVCGLDSMVLGEDEILHQVKEAYLFAKSNGYTNGELNIIFQSAFNCAKLSKNKTRLSSTPLSVGTLTAKVVEEYLKAETGKTNQRVLVIGATGKIADLMPAIVKHGTEKYFVPMSDVHTDEIKDLLDSKKITHTEAVMYRTVSNDFTPEEKFDYDMLLFFSPAGITSLIKNFPDFDQKNIAIGCFGPTTAKAVKEAGLRLDLEATTADAPSMPAALDKFIAENNKD